MALIKTRGLHKIITKFPQGWSPGIPRKNPRGNLGEMDGSPAGQILHFLFDTK